MGPSIEVTGRISTLTRHFRPQSGQGASLSLLAPTAWPASLPVVTDLPASLPVVIAFPLTLLVVIALFLIWLSIHPRWSAYSISPFSFVSLIIAPAMSYSVSPRNQDFHYHGNAETYLDVGTALGEAMVELKGSQKR